MQAFALSDEQRRAEIVLELADPRRHVGLHAMQPLRRAGYAALAHHGAEDPQLRQIHASLLEIKII
jgi:hypothetical protein